MAPGAVNAGNGFMFVAYNGDVFPSGFLPVAAGNVRERSPGEIYRESPVFRALRAPESFHGKCGICEYRDICGGSRSRAFALTGDYLASEPWCVFEPPRP